jgi:ankyrin repeat protein
MIRGGADIHVVDNSGSTALHYAVKSRMKETIDLLLEKGASAVSKDNAGLSPMNYAFYRDRSEGPYYSHNADPETIDALLGAGADPLEHGRDGQTALHYLAFYLMTASSVDKKDMTLYEYLGRNETPVDRFEIYSKLYNRFVDAGCDREARDNNGNTPLFMYVAAVKPYSDQTMNYPPDPKDVQQMFQEHDMHAVNNAGDTLLHVVARREKDEYGPNDTVELWKMLVELGLDPKKENKENASPLDTAAAFGNEDILALYTRDE